jgi:CheY-like chemotaxis protein
VRPAANARQITVTAVIDPSASPAVCDDVRIQQVVWNLLSNAVKFTPKGGCVHVVLDREESQALITVSDNGQGIEPGLLPYVFDRFRQADSSTRRKLGGLGLGLSIVKHIVEHHGGTQAVQISSKTADVDPSKGEHATRERQERLETAIELSGIRILLVDDEVDALRLVGKVLAEAGASITMAGSVSEAMVAVDKEVPHILISDLGMPDEDGFDLIQWVRGAGHTAEQLPAVALTAFANKGHEDSALLSGFQIHVPKPVDPDRLIAVVASLTRREHSSRQGA